MSGTRRFATDDSFPSERTLREAHRLADTLSDKRARAAVAALFEPECINILGAADRRELLEEFFAARAARQHRLLTGLGLSVVSTDPNFYAPGTWRLSAEPKVGGHIFVISGIRTASGGEEAARLQARDIQKACLAWRAVAAAASVNASEKPRTAEWYRIWWGSDCRTARRQQRGLCGALFDEFRNRWEGGGHDAP